MLLRQFVAVLSKIKYFASSVPFVVVTLGLISQFFAAITGSLWFWVLNIAYYTYFLIEQWQSKQIRKFQEDAQKNFQFPTITSNIRVLTYNIFLRPPFVKNNMDDFKNERLKGFIDQVLSKNYFDVILLQEIFNLGNTRQRKLLEVARKAGYVFHARGVGIPLFSKKFIDAGLLILSKYPIVERDAHLYRHGNQIDSWAAKQMIYAKIKVSQWQYVHLFTTHMQASYFDSEDHQNVINDKSRLGQVDELADFIHSKIHNSPFPAIVAGDFNIHARMANELDSMETKEYQYLIRKLNKDGASCSPSHCAVRDLLKEDTGCHPNTYADVCVEGKPREVVLTHTADLGTALCIDHMLYVDTISNVRSGGITVMSGTTKVEEFLVNPSSHPFTQLSDHYGISTIVTVNPKAASI